MEISFNQAKEALGKLRKQQLPNGGQNVPELLKVKGKPGIKIYQLKCDIENTFQAEIERFRDLLQERQEAGEERTKEINEELADLLQEEKELELNRGKLQAEEIESVLDADILQELGFAIELDGQ